MTSLIFEMVMHMRDGCGGGNGGAGVCTEGVGVGGDILCGGTFDIALVGCDGRVLVYPSKAEPRGMQQ